MVFGLLRARGYGDDYVARYRLVARFFQQKRPLIILIAGSACTGAAGRARKPRKAHGGLAVQGMEHGTCRASASLAALHLLSLEVYALPAPRHAGKSSLAQQLASRLNLPNVLQTDVLYEVSEAEDEQGGFCLPCRPADISL